MRLRFGIVGGVGGGTGAAFFRLSICSKNRAYGRVYL